MSEGVQMETLVGVIGLIASIASLVLAVVAIWLSIVFYRFAQSASDESTKSANSIQSAVDRLEKLFDSLYADTFSMMRDTVGDMRKHIWQRPSSGEKEAEAAVSESANAEILAAIREASEELGITQKQVAELVQRVEPRVKESVEEVRVLPVSSMKRRVRSTLQRRPQGMRVASLRRYISGSQSVPPSVFLKALYEMRDEGSIDWEGDALEGGTLIVASADADE